MKLRYTSAKALGVAWILWAVSRAAASAMGNAPRDPLASIFDTGFAMGTVWEDGKAEVSRYAGREMRYGAARDAEWWVIVGRELDRPGNWVKAADPNEPRLVEALTMSQVLSVSTGITSGHQMLTSTFRRANLENVKTVVTSQEWLGQTWKQLTHDGKGAATLRYESYWSDEGSGKRRLDLPRGALIFDDLVVWLRALRNDAPASFELDLVTTLASSHVGEPRVEKATVTVAHGDPLSVAGRSWNARRVEVRRGSAIDRFWFDEDGTAPMLRWRKADGSMWSLAETNRLAYWRWTHPGDTIEAAVVSERKDGVPAAAFPDDR